ncbi:MAG: cytochrome c biogenesis protein [Melioribacteraceae bacterium]|nr:cytochrome c biogenesis protein [Melioribacteraceae bacterium]MCF8355886.1 cytochrome c biogenesis protein [Melioribacteraceae bacterium]MCF8395205.1 cytochrome c biogenesis protein [Melioribacteraceae bacterium]MCF8420679.1 cytochrome c biogenesis protein [Melioribacteraceae bacterium]
MIDSIHIHNVVIPFLYLITFVVYVYDFVKDKPMLNNAKRVFLFITLILHTFYLLSRTIEFDHPPITNKFEIFTVLAFALSFSYFILELLTDVRGTGLFIIAFSIVLQIASSLFIEDLVEVKTILRSNLLGIHVISAMLGYSGITISAVYGILFLMLYKRMKSNEFGLIFKRLPNLESLEKLSFIAAIIGYVLLTISILIGGMWLPNAFPDFSYFDPKLISTFIVWVVYTIGIITKLTGNLYGKRIIVFNLSGFALAIVSLILTTFITNTFHSFY